MLLLPLLTAMTLTAGSGATAHAPQAERQNPEASLSSKAASLAGEWVGVIRSPSQIRYARIRFETANGHTRLAVLSMQPGSPVEPMIVQSDASRVQFTLRTNADELHFSGELRDGRISGLIRSAQGPGRFEFVRHHQIAPQKYDEYAGAYELEPGRLLVVRRGDDHSWDKSCSLRRSWLHFVDSAGKARLLFPAARDQFFAGPGFLLPLPKELAVTFVRGESGAVTGIRWREHGQMERYARRTKRYMEESVRFQSGGKSLGARLLTPSGKGPHPAIVAIQGGPGPANRNSQYLAVIDVLVANGIAALIYDKPGCGESGGDWHSQSYDDMAEDALAAVRFLQTRKRIDPRKVGLWGISEGGWIAPLAAMRSPDVAFLVLVSAGGLSHAALDHALLEPTLREAGTGEPEIQEAIGFEKLTMDFVRTGEDWPKLRLALEEAKKRPWLPYTTVFTHTGGNLPSTADHWFWRLYRLSAHHDPVATISKVEVPVLAIWGGSDRAAPPDLNLPELARGLRQGKNPDYTLLVFGSGEHVLWQLDKPSWVQVERYVPAYFQTTTDWILDRTRRRPTAAAPIQPAQPR